MDRLATSLAGESDDIRRALEEAYAELEGLEAKRERLREMIRRAEAILGVTVPIGRNLTLHKALEIVLRDLDNSWTHVKELANEVNARKLYVRRDGGEVQPNQVHARTKNYVQMFEKDGPMVRLRTDASPSGTAPRRSSKYDALAERLRSVTGQSVTLDIDDIARMVGGLPPSAYDHPAWWANESVGSHVQARSWMDHGWRVDGFDIADGWVRFRRT